MIRLQLLSVFLTCMICTSWSQNRQNRHTLGIQVSGYESWYSEPGFRTQFILFEGFPREYFLSNESGYAYSLGTTHGYWILNWFKWDSSISLATVNAQYQGEVFSRNTETIERQNIEVWSLIKKVEGRNFIFNLEIQSGPHFTFGNQKLRPFVYPYFKLNYYLDNRRKETLTYQDDYVLERTIVNDQKDYYSDKYTSFGIGLGFEAGIGKRLDMVAMLFQENYRFRGSFSINAKAKNRGLSLRLNYWLNKIEN